MRHLRLLGLGALLLATGAVLRAGSPGDGPKTDRPPRIGARALAAQFDSAFEAAWKEQGLEPAEALEDGPWLRRLSLDLRGAIPSLSELEAFLADPAEDRRARKIDEYLGSRDFAGEQAREWTRSLLREGGKIAENMGERLTPWIEQQLLSDPDFGTLTREMLTSARPGGPDDPSPLGFVITYHDSVESLAGVTARVFLGLQIQCAQCHDHPDDHWKQKEFDRFAGFFAETFGRAYPRAGKNNFGVVDMENARYLSRKIRAIRNHSDADGMLDAMSLPDASGSLSMEGSKHSAPLQHTEDQVAAIDALVALLDAESVDQGAVRALRPRLPTQVDDLVDTFLHRMEHFATAAFLDGTVYEDGTEPSRREALAKWMTDAANPWFATAVVNRTWFLLFGHSPIEPMDDLSGGKDREFLDLLDQLAQDFVASGHDLRELVRVLVSTRAYGLGNSRTESRLEREREERWFAAHPVRPMTSHQFARSLVQAMGEDPSSAEGVEVRDALLSRLRTAFETDATGLGGEAAARISQALFLVNAVYEDCARTGLRPNFLLGFRDEERSMADRLRPAFLALLARAPTEDEVAAVADRFDVSNEAGDGGGDRHSRVMDDVLWALLNTSEFHSNH